MPRAPLLLAALILLILLAVAFGGGRSGGVGNHSLSGSYWVSVLPASDRLATQTWHELAPATPLPAGSVALVEAVVEANGDGEKCQATLLARHPDPWQLAASDLTDFTVDTSSATVAAVKASAPDYIENVGGHEKVAGTVLGRPLPDQKTTRHLRLIFSVPPGASDKQFSISRSIICSDGSDAIRDLTYAGTLTTP
jgi:hypothetical protein